VSDKQLTRVVLVALAALVGLYVLYQLREIVGAVFVAVFVSIALAPAVSHVQKIVHYRLGAICLVYTVLILLAGGLILLIVPPVIEGINRLAVEAPFWIEQAGRTRWFQNLDAQYGIEGQLQKVAASLPAQIPEALALLKSLAVGAVGAMIQVIAILVISFFLLLDGDRISEWLISQMPGEKERRAREMSGKIYHAVGGYVAGALILGSTTGLSSFLVMSLLGIPFATTLSVLMGFLGLIPLVGATIGGLLIAVAAVTVNFPSVLIIWVVFFICYQQLENHVFQPLIYKRTVALHPILVLLAVLIGGSQLGIVGALFAIPVAATAQIAARDWWTHRPERSKMKAD
jgi:predicted PurR-regulated permease PerM